LFGVVVGIGKDIVHFKACAQKLIDNGAKGYRL
jgi:hypothetical protein